MPLIFRVVFLVLLLIGGRTSAEDPGWPRVGPAGERPDDSRYAPPRHLRDAYHPWSPPETEVGWRRTALDLRHRILVSSGLWPRPEKTPLNARVIRRVERDDHIVEIIAFESLPGHFVTGSLYRPRESAGRLPGVLSPHGHFHEGRFHDAGETRAQAEIESGAESLVCAARHPLQARLVQLARMGCVVFHHDMVGYASSKSIGHRDGFRDADSAAHLHSTLGLQTWNSIRALDYLCSRPEVDASRIGVTGASGGGTQTFLLCAIDPRPTVAFPAAMVSTGMQGGCVCENAPYLRIGTNNVGLTALFAPRPLALSGANDWTREIETRGLPELKKVYALTGAPDAVTARCWPRFGHNFNEVARGMMYEWFKRHLELDQTTAIEEREFVPLTRAELDAFPDGPPAGAVDAAELRRHWKERDREALARGGPSVKRIATEVLLDSPLPVDGLTWTGHRETVASGLTRVQMMVARPGGERTPLIGLRNAGADSPARGHVVWIDGRGKSTLFGPDGAPIAAVQRLLDLDFAVFAADVWGTGEFLTGGEGPYRLAVNADYCGYTYAYNRPLISERVGDICAALFVLHRLGDGKTPVHLIGTGGAGPWVLLARRLLGPRVGGTVADLRGFGFSRITEANDPDFLPGALKYGGIGGLAAAASSEPLAVVGTGGCPEAELAPLTRPAEDPDTKRILRSESPTLEEIAGLLHELTW